LGEAFFAAVFFGAAFFEAFGTAGAWVFVTRPDLVLPSTRDTSASTAGAGAAVLRGLLALALGFVAAAAFLGAAFAAAVFLGAAFLVAAVVVVVVVVLAFYKTVSMSSWASDLDSYGSSSLLGGSSLLLGLLFSLLLRLGLGLFGGGSGGSRLGLLLCKLHSSRGT
jgi:hypothetical protein